MNEPAATEPKKRGLPRSEKARRAILEAASELLLAEALADMSMDKVAARAGVSKATIYRWWPSKETLALDALFHEWESAPTLPDTGSLRGDLLALLRPWVRRLRTRPYGRVIAALLAAAHADSDFAEQYRARFVEARREPARAIVKRAIKHGELAADTNVDLALDLVYGPVYHRLLHGHAPLTERFAQDVVEAALKGLGVAPGVRERSIRQRTFTSVLEGVDVPSWIIDHRGTFVWLNDAYTNRFGDHHGDQIWSTVSPKCADDVKQRLMRLSTGTSNVGAAVHFEVEAVVHDGRAVRSEISAVRLQPGRFRGAIFGVILTKRRRKNTIPSHLTRRQLEVLQLLAAGRSTQQIAAELVLSPQTIRNHVRGILRTFRTHSRLEAIVEAQRQGFIR